MTACRRGVMAFLRLSLRSGAGRFLYLVSGLSGRAEPAAESNVRQSEAAGQVTLSVDTGGK